MTIHLDPEKRHEFVLLFDAKDSNPNGDPVAGNLPRIDPQTEHGLVTDGAIKRKIRDYAADILRLPIFIQSTKALNAMIKDAFEEAGAKPIVLDLSEADLENKELVSWLQEKSDLGISIDGEQLVYAGESNKQADIAKLLIKNLDDERAELRPRLTELARRLAQEAGKRKDRGINNEMRNKAQALLCKNYFDIRIFGAVLQTGLNAGQVRGPVQMTFARSIDPIFHLDHTITRHARTTTDRMETGPTEFARKPVVPYGLYRAHGYFNPFLAKKTGVDEKDLEVLWEALQRLFEFDRSASRSGVHVRRLWVFTHENPKGNAPAHKLFDLIRVPSVDTPRSFSDYEDRIDAPEPGVLAGQGYPGVTLTRLL